MRALVLSGGKATRLRPITHTSAKQLIPVAGAPILFHALDAIAAAGITEVGIVVGATTDEVARRGGRRRPVGPARSPTSSSPSRSGIAHAVMSAADFVRGRAVPDVPGRQRPARRRDRVRPRVRTRAARCPDLAGAGPGARAVRRGRCWRATACVRLVEKPTEFVSDLALVGVYLFDDSVLEACASARPRPPGASTRSPRRSSGSSTTGARSGPSASRAGGRTPADPRTSWRRTASSWAPRPHAATARWTPRPPIEGWRWSSAGAKVRASRLVGPVFIGAGCTIERVDDRPGRLARARMHRLGQRRSRTRS